MSKLKVDQFVDLVKKSGLVDNERLNQALSGVDQSVKDSGLVASVLTKADLLTEWQAEKLQQGRHRGFFLGKYKLLRHLGTGGMGAVFLAQHIVMQHKVAIKVLAGHLSAKQSYLERFHQEARALVKCNHPNMVRAYDVDQEGNNHYLIMEFVDGCDLQAIVSRSGPLDYRTAAEYTRQAAEGLAHAHVSGLIHRDIKPANLLIDGAGTVKILDMGLARFTDETQGSLTREYDQKMIGTVDYQPPEQACDSHKVDGRADIYSLGCTLYFMLTGDAPFPTGTIPQRVMQHQSAQPRDVRELRPDAPEGLLAICQKMMAKKPEDRYQSGDDVAAVLADWLEGREPDRVAMQRYRQSPQQAGPSLNENLDLAPLDDEPPSRGRPAPSKEAKPAESKPSGIAAGANAKKPDTSPAKKPAGSAVTDAGKSGVRSDKKSPSAKKPAPKAESASDLLDELLNVSALPKSDSTSGPPLTQLRKKHKEEESGFPRWLILTLLLGGGLLAIIAAIVVWATGA